ncbi:MAG: nitroreductase family protein [Desulforhopalus sp.]
MKLVAIDKNRCTGCVVCASICPYNAIILKDGKAEYCLETCFFCGQCRAVCPVDAIALRNISDKLGLSSIRERQGVVQPGDADPADLVALMRSRRSCRKFLDKPVDLDLLTDLVKIGTTAPSGTNSQSWNFLILPSRPDLEAFGELVGAYYRKLNRLAANPLLRVMMKVAGNSSLQDYYRNYYDSVKKALSEWDNDRIDRLFHGAVAGIVVTGKNGASCPAEDAMLATQNILLSAHTLGLGSCLIGFAVEAMRRMPAIRKKIKLAADEQAYAVIVLGYPAVVYQRPAHRRAVQPRILRMTSL